MAPRDKKGILFILRAVVESYLSALCVHSRLANVLLRFNLDNKFQRGGGTESYVPIRPLRINQGSSQSQLFRAAPLMFQHCDVNSITGFSTVNVLFPFQLS